MKRVMGFVLAVAAAACPDVKAAPGQEELRPGLVAHYFKDPDNWGGNWPEGSSLPRVSPLDWTFRDYRYSRIEPLLNHEFVRRGWFSVRWTGYFDPAGGGASDGNSHAVGGRVNINPMNRDGVEFSILKPDGATVSRDDFGVEGFTGYTGAAAVVRLTPKGNRNANGLTVDGSAYELLNGRAYDILSSAMAVRLTNDRMENGQPRGDWWLEVEAAGATILRHGGNEGRDEGEAEQAYVFTIQADDGCRLILDGKVLIDSWIACSEESPRSWRRSAPVVLKGGPHRLVVEYFQGLSLRFDDRDPIRLHWTCETRGIERAVIPPPHFKHAPADVAGNGR